MPVYILLLFQLLLTSPDTIQKPAQLPSPEQIAHVLQNSGNGQKQELIRELKLVIPKWSFVKATADHVCTSIDEVKLDLVTLQHPGTQAVLQVSGCRYVFLVVLRYSSKGGWNHVATVPLDDQYGQSKRISFPELISVGNHEIVAHRVSTLRGTGMWQYNMSIFKLFDDRLELIFDEPEEVNYSVPDLADRRTQNTQQRQESVFAIRDLAQDYMGPRALKYVVERQVIRDHDSEIVRGFSFTWDPSVRRFRSAPSFPSP